MYLDWTKCVGHNPIKIWHELFRVLHYFMSYFEPKVCNVCMYHFLRDMKDLKVGSMQTYIYMKWIFVFCVNPVAHNAKSHNMTVFILIMVQIAQNRNVSWSRCVEVLGITSSLIFMLTGKQNCATSVRIVNYLLRKLEG